MIGQKRVANYLLNAVRNGRLVNSYILEGPKGIGKKTMAHFLGRAVHCEVPENAPCGECAQCVKHIAGYHPHYSVITPAAANISIEQIRDMIKDVYIKPIYSGKKIYVLPDADSLLLGPAQNALLKVFEEPPEYGLILLLAQNAKGLLPTIRSRAVILKLDLNSKQECRDFLSGFERLTPGEADFIAAYCGGILGRAADMAGAEDFMRERTELYSLLPSLAEPDHAELIPLSEALERGKENHGRLLDLMSTWMRDVLIFKTAPGRPLINSDYHAHIESFAAKLSEQSAARTLTRIAQVRTQIGKYSNYPLWIYELLVKCWEEIHG